MSHLEAVTDNRNAVVMAGYQAGGTRGRKLLDGDQVVKIFGQDVQVKARIEAIETLSAHADYQELIDWLKGSDNLHPKQVFVVHGEPDAADAFRLQLQDQLGWQARVPDYMTQHEVC